MLKPNMYSVAKRSSFSFAIVSVVVPFLKEVARRVCPAGLVAPNDALNLKEISDRFVQLPDAYSTVSVNFRTAEDSIAVTSLTYSWNSGASSRSRLKINSAPLGEPTPISTSPADVGQRWCAGCHRTD